MNNLNIPYTITDNSIVLFIDGKTLTVNKNDTRFGDVKNAIRSENFSVIPELLDLKGTLIADSGGGLYLLNGMLRCDKYDVPAVLGARIVTMKKEGFNIKPLVNFLDNLWSNPGLTSRSDDENQTIVEEIYEFVEACNLPITSDGCILAYKMVRKDFKDIYSNTMDNSVGTVVKMDRANVDPFRNNTCSSGLHFCSQEYLNGGYSNARSGQVVVVKINPRDICSIPKEYGTAKGRACQYEVVDTIPWDDVITPLFTTEYGSESDNAAPELTLSPDVTANRWEVRDSNSGDLLGSFPVRSDARDFHRKLENTFIWDVYTNTVTGGSVSDELDLKNLPPAIVNDDSVTANPSAKLNDNIVRKIRNILIYEDYESIAALARRYGVSDRTIRRIRDNESWTHVVV